MTKNVFHRELLTFLSSGAERRGSGAAPPTGSASTGNPKSAHLVSRTPRLSRVKRGMSPDIASHLATSGFYVVFSEL